MIRLVSIFLDIGVVGCSSGTQGNLQPFQPFPGQGQYVRPFYQNPAPTPRIPPTDTCRSQLYLNLVGRHEGSIYVAGLPSPKRIIKPAFTEGFDYEQDDFFYSQPPLLQVTDYLADQTLYAPSIRTVSDLLQLGPAQDDRLTIELDNQNYVQAVRCE